MAAEGAEEDYDGQGHCVPISTTPSWCVMRDCDLEPLQFDWFRATMLLNALS